MAFDDDIKTINRRIGQIIQKGERDIARQYARELLNIRAKMAEQYEKYEKDGSLSYAEMLKNDRLKKLMGEIEQSMKARYKEVGGEMSRILGDTYTDGFYSTAHAIETATAVQLGYSAVSKETIGAMIENPVDKLTLNDRLEKQRGDVIHKIKQNITQGLISNETYSSMTKRLKSTLEGDAVKAMRIVRTEGHRVQESAKHDAADHASKNGVIMMKEWNTLEDSRVRRGKRTSANHAQLNGVKIAMDELFNDGLGEGDAPGQLGAAGSDINCRCFLTYSIEAIEKPKYDPLTGMPFDDWIETQVKPVENPVEPPNPKAVDAIKAAAARRRQKTAATNKPKATGNTATATKPKVDGKTAVERVRAAAKAAAAEAERKKKEGVAAIVKEGSGVASAAKKAAKVPGKQITPAALDNFKKITETGMPFNTNNIRKNARVMLDNIGLQRAKVSIKQLKGANGAVEYYSTRKGPDVIADVIQFSLSSTDKRAERYKVKTLFHEFYHANYNGLKLDQFLATRVSWEETATETAAHFMMKEKGFNDMIVPSYAKHLVNNLPRLKQLDEFKDAVSIEDFGAVFMKYRFDPEYKTGQWRWLDNAVRESGAGTSVNVKEYAAKHYNDYIRENKDECLADLCESIGEGRSKDERLRGLIERDLGRGLDSGAENEGYNMAIVWAMKKIGVK